MRLYKKAGTWMLCAALACSMSLQAGAASGTTSDQETGAAAASVNTLSEGESTQDPGQDPGQESESLSRIALSVGDGQQTPVYKAGEKDELKINVTNKGNTDARNVTIAPVVEKTEEWPFEMDQLNYEQELGSIKAGEQAQAIWGGGEEKLTVRKDVTGKSYKLVFKITYDDENKAYEIEKYVFVKTEAEKTSTDDGTGSGGGSGSGNTGNTGSGDNGSGSGSAGSGDNGSGSGSGSGSTGGSGSGSDGGWSSGDLDMSGGVSNGDTYVSGGDGGESATDNSVPRVIVTGFDTQPAVVKAGSDFKLIIHLKNTSKKTAVTNMLFDLQAPAAGSDDAAEAPAFLPVSGSSSIYLDRIPAGGTKDISIELNSRADLVQKPYSITMTMQYENSDAVQFESQSSLAVPVTQDARFEFSEIQIMPDTVMVGDEANISCSIYNLGRVKMYNVKIRFEGDAISGQELFLGNLESGGTGVVDGFVTAEMESYEESNCKLVLSYEDDSGNETTVEEPFTMTVTPAEEYIDTGEFDMDMTLEEESSSAGWVIAAILAGIVLAAVAAVVIVKQKKKRNEMAEEEELMDEVERFTEDERRKP